MPQEGSVKDRQTMEVTFWGTRGSISTPGRGTEKYGGNTPCVSVTVGDIQIILDAGTGIRNLGLEVDGESIGKEKISRFHLFLSHTHWDHIQGLPFFQPLYEPHAHLTVYGSRKKGRFLSSILKGQMDVDYFPIGLSELAATLDIQEISSRVIRLGPVMVDWEEQSFHPGGSVRYRLSLNGKKIVYATDVELDRLYEPTISKREREAHLKRYIKFVENADILIADGQYTEEEYPKKAGWGHTSIPVLIDLALQAQVRQLAIFHHDPRRLDAEIDDLWRMGLERIKAKGSHMTLFWAREGMTLAI